MIAISVYFSIITQICPLLVQKNLHHFLNKSDAKLKPITTLVARVFPRFSGQNGCFTCSSYWLLKLFLFFWSAFEISLILLLVIQSKSAMVDRLDLPRVRSSLHPEGRSVGSYSRAYLIHCTPIHWYTVYLNIIEPIWYTV